MADRFLYFTFDGIKSSTYNCFYRNDGEDLIFPMFPAFNDVREAPLFQKTDYYVGTSINNRSFTLNCACENITLNRFRQLQRWLAIDKIGEFSLDFSTNYHWKVKVSSVSEPTLLPLDDKKIRFHCLFTIVFTTIEDHAAISNFTYNFSLTDYRFTPQADGSIAGILDQDYRIPVIDYEPVTLDPKVPKTVGLKTVRLFNTQSYEYYLKTKFYDTTNIALHLYNKNKYYKLNNNKKESKLWFNYPMHNILGSERLTLESNSQFGYIVDTNSNELLEEKLIDRMTKNTATISNEGSYAIPSSNIFQQEMKLTGISMVSVPNKTNTQHMDGLRLTFTVDKSDELIPFDYGTTLKIDDSQYVIENDNGKGIFIQSLGFEDYLLYNEGEYNSGFYYVDKQYTFYSYTFNAVNNQFQVILTNLKDIEKFSDYFINHLNYTFLVSIADYTELNILNVYGDNGKYEGTTELEFNLRTVF